MDLVNDVVDVKSCVEKVEDWSDAILRKVGPYARIIAKFCILFFHLTTGILIITNYTSMSEFISWTFGFYTFAERETDMESEELDKDELPGMEIERLSYAGHFITFIIFLSRVVPIYFVLANKYVISACVALSVFPLALGLHFVVSAPYHSYWIVWTCFGLIGSLIILAAEQLDEKTDLGIPSLGLNKKMSLVTLMARLSTIFVSLPVHSTLERYLHPIHPVFLYSQLLIIVPSVLCVCIGYRTKIAALVFSVYLFVIANVTNPFWFYFQHPFMLGVYVCMYSANLAAIGGLLYITLLGAGQYSVDHYKKST